MSPASVLLKPHRSRSSGSSAAKVAKPSIERMWAPIRIEAAFMENRGQSSISSPVRWRARQSGSDPDFPLSAVLELRSALLDEGRHAFLLVLEREGGVEEAPLEMHA